MSEVAIVLVEETRDADYKRRITARRNGSEFVLYEGMKFGDGLELLFPTIPAYYFESTGTELSSSSELGRLFREALKTHDTEVREREDVARRALSDERRRQYFASIRSRV